MGGHYYNRLYILKIIHKLVPLICTIDIIQATIYVTYLNGTTMKNKASRKTILLPIKL